LRGGRALTDLRQLRRSIGWVTSTLEAQIPRGEPAFSQLLALDRGQVFGSGPTRELLEGPVIEQLYDGAVSELVWRGGRCWPIGR
jgi:hypothetical protein